MDIVEGLENQLHYIIHVAPCKHQALLICNASANRNWYERNESIHQTGEYFAQRGPICVNDTSFSSFRPFCIMLVSVGEKERSKMSPPFRDPDGLSASNKLLFKWNVLRCRLRFIRGGLFGWVFVNNWDKMDLIWMDGLGFGIIHWCVFVTRVRTFGSKWI